MGRRDKSRELLYQRPELKAAFDRFDRQVMMLKVVVFAMLGTLALVVLGFWAGLVSAKAALVVGGTDLAAIVVLILYVLPPWKWTFYSATAKRS